jgi:hypothetical protein
MLLLLFKNFMWAAWWPYCTMLLAMEKAAAQQAAARPKSPPPQAAPAPQPRPAPAPQSRPEPAQTPSAAKLREEGSSAPNPELPQALRELMKMSIDQARRGF